MAVDDDGGVPEPDEPAAVATGERSALHDADAGRDVREQLTAPNATGESALALLLDDGTVQAWVRAAERYIGLATGDAVGRRADFFLGPDNGLTVSAFADQLGSPLGWSDVVQTPGGERRSVQLSRLYGPGGEICWLLAALTGPASGTSRRHASADPRPVGRAVWDLGLHCILINEAMEQTASIPQGQRLGNRIMEVAPGFEAEALETVMRYTVRTGRTAVDYRYQRRGKTSRHNQLLVVSAFRLDDADGTPFGVCTLGVDVTQVEKARKRQAVLGQASARIGTTDDVMRTAQELADVSPCRASPTTPPSTWPSPSGSAKNRWHCWTRDAAACRTGSC